MFDKQPPERMKVVAWSVTEKSATLNVYKQWPRAGYLGLMNHWQWVELDENNIPSAMLSCPLEHHIVPAQAEMVDHMTSYQTYSLNEEIMVDC